jgi:hypothetical protein
MDYNVLAGVKLELQKRVSTEANVCLCLPSCLLANKCIQILKRVYACGEFG